jgi:hypothetical protein
MPKQIKLGLDKVPAPVTKQFTQLIDIEGNLLFDAAGNPVITEDEATLGSFSTSAGSTSININNRDNNPIISIPVEEQFSETSEVSSSLLGVPRAEEQLSLFSDVSTYGLDEDNWNYYTFSGNSSPAEWYNKENPIFGSRQNPAFYEGSEEQALYLKSFPSQYTFPGSTIAENRSTATETMKSYMNFIAMGRYLYNIFEPINPVFAESNFLNSNIEVVNSQNTTIPTATAGAFIKESLSFNGDGNFFDVEYGPDFQDSCNQIERYTYIFGRMIDGDAGFPDLPTNQYPQGPDFTDTDIGRAAREFLAKNCRPGGSSTSEKFAILQSNKTFRYQPGRASGFTFGVRQQTDTSSSASFIEWGCSNDTDEYMFQLRGSTFNIIRRSTIRMPDALLVRQGLEASDQSDKAIQPKGVGTGDALWETVIPRTKFNGDSMLGSGKSGYILSFEDVTMYKIEFSWYGAIGAKFYAYAPASVGEARWILMHTFVIENGLGKPVLNNPDFKFKYLIYTADTATLKYPIYLYKYGSSYYVDGGDEGTINLTSVTADSKEFTQRTPIIGILPKQELTNTAGDGILNFKKAYPTTLSVTSDKATRVDIESIAGSPDGVHYSYAPSLHNGTHALSRNLNFKFNGTVGSTIDLPTGNTVSGGNFVVGTVYKITSLGNTTNQQWNTAAGTSGINYSVTGTYNCFTAATAGTGTGTVVDNILDIKDDYGKIIADGIYNTYLRYNEFNKSSSPVYRKQGYNLVTGGDVRISKSQKMDGSVIDTSTGPTFSGKITNFHSVSTSTVPIQANNFKIHWLDPDSRASSTVYRHFTDYAICIGENLGFVDGTDGNKLKYTKGDGTTVPFNFDDVISVKGSQVGTAINYSNKAEYVEWDPSYGDRFDVDVRLPRPAGEDSGSVSAVKGEVRVVNYGVSSVEEGTGDFAGKFKITFSSSAPTASMFPLDSTGAVIPGTSEVGVNGEGLGIFYVTAPEFNSSSQYFIYVDENPNTFGGSRNIVTTGVQTKTITLTDDWQLADRFSQPQFTVSKAVKFNAQPLYLTIAMHDEAKVNSIVVEEITQDNVQVSTPKFIKGDECPNLSIVASGLSSDVLSPSAFISEDKQSSIRFDTQTLNPLRPGVNIYSFFIAANIPAQFDLSNIFGRDRKGLARGLLNNQAVFLTASSVDGSTGNIEMTLTAKEQ